VVQLADIAVAHEGLLDIEHDPADRLGEFIGLRDEFTGGLIIQAQAQHLSDADGIAVATAGAGVDEVMAALLDKKAEVVMPWSMRWCSESM